MSLSYKSAGVNIDAGNEAVRRIKDKVKTTFDKNVVTGLGSFGAMYDAAWLKRYQEPVLVQSVDGVGTKLKIAALVGNLETVGEDIVNHCCDDVLLGLASSGIHTNGASLVRKIFFENNNYTVDSHFEELKFSLGRELVEPHKSYVKSVLPLVSQLNGIAHITGGGFIENIPRILPEGLAVEIKKHSWEVLPIFKVIQKVGAVAEEEMYRVFNMGIGLVLIIDGRMTNEVRRRLEEKGEKVYEIGKVVKGKKGVRLI